MLPNNSSKGSIHFYRSLIGVIHQVGNLIRLCCGTHYYWPSWHNIGWCILGDRCQKFLNCKTNSCIPQRESSIEQKKLFLFSLRTNQILEITLVSGNQKGIRYYLPKWQLIMKRQKSSKTATGCIRKRWAKGRLTILGKNQSIADWRSIRHSIDTQ